MCVSRLLGLGQGNVPQVPPIGERGIFPSRASSNSGLRVAHTSGRPPMIRIPPWRCCCLDDFTQLFKDWQQHHLIPSDRQRQQAGRLSLGQMLHHGALPSLPRQGLQAFLRLWSGAGVSPLLAGLPSTSRFVALRPGLLLPFDLLLHCFRGQKTGIYVVDHQGQIMAVKITGGNMDTANHWSP